MFSIPMTVVRREKSSLPCRVDKQARAPEAACGKAVNRLINWFICCGFCSPMPDSTAISKALNCRKNRPGGCGIPSPPQDPHLRQMSLSLNWKGAEVSPGEKKPKPPPPRLTETAALRRCRQTPAQWHRSRSRPEPLFPAASGRLCATGRDFS